MPRVRVFPYKQGSRSAKALATGIGGRVLKLEGSSFNPRLGDRIINWGSTTMPEGLAMLAYNKPDIVQRASNKRAAFQYMKEAGVSVPDFWVHAEDIPDDAFPIVCRTILNGHSGVGIVIADTRADLAPAPLYVRYVKKQDEYRVHVVGTSIITVQRKARRHDHPNPNWQVRNHSNGFVFVRAGVNPPNSVFDEATKSIEALGLDFGAVDIIFNANENRAYVLEVNTAPGLEGQTVDDYVTGFKELMNG